MKIWFISDTHNEHLGLQVLEVDLVIQCGDESTHGNAWMNEPEVRRFLIGTRVRHRNHGVCIGESLDGRGTGSEPTASESNISRQCLFGRRPL